MYELRLNERERNIAKNQIENEMVEYEARDLVNLNQNIFENNPFIVIQGDYQILSYFESFQGLTIKKVGRQDGPEVNLLFRVSFNDEDKILFAQMMDGHPLKLAFNPIRVGKSKRWKRKSKRYGTRRI